MVSIDLAEDDKFNRAAANLSNIPDGETFTMANFTYENNVVLSRMFKHLHDTFFPGITVSKHCVFTLLVLLFA